MNINKLREEITEQTRNGRDRIYISTEDLKDLGYKNVDNTERQYIDRNILESLIQKYEFKSNLKTKVKPTGKVSSKVKKQREVSDCWDSISK